MPMKTQTTMTAGFAASMAGFLYAELQIAANLIRLARNAEDSERKCRYLSKARIACNAIEHFLPRTPVSEPEKTKIERSVHELESDLKAVSEIPAVQPRETPPRWNFLDAFTTSQVDDAPADPLFPLLSPSTPETPVDRFMTGCAFAQRSARTMVRQNREIMARSGLKLF